MRYVKYYAHNMARGRKLYEGPRWQVYALGAVVLILQPVFICIPSYREQVKDWWEHEVQGSAGGVGSQATE